MNQRKQGYILVLTLLIISVAVVVIAYIFTRSSIFVPYVDTMIKREKAQMLALGGIQVAIGQLSVVIEESEEKKKEVAEGEEKQLLTPDTQAKLLLATIVPVLNQWQTITLYEERDQIKGIIKIAISSENGKININEIYDFKKHAFLGDKQPQGDWKKVLQELFSYIQRINGGTHLFEALEKFLKGRNDKLNDVTELLLIPEFSVFKQAVFYEPVSRDEKDKEKTKSAIYLTDIFTVSTKTSTLEPWLLSSGMQELLGIKSILSIGAKKEAVEKLLKPFKQKVTWSSDWNTILKPLYGKELQSLPKGIESVFSTTFEPTVFAVLSYGTVGAVTQRLFAIIERRKRLHNAKTVYDNTIKRLYWL